MFSTNTIFVTLLYLTPLLFTSLNALAAPNNGKRPTCRLPDGTLLRGNRKNPFPDSSVDTSTTQPSVLDPHPGKPKITFRSDGTFKLTVFSDLHFGENPWDWWGPEHDAASVNLMRNVLASENPDYVVFNGDQITGENTFKQNSTNLVDQVLGPVIQKNVPFSSTYGNHDNQPNISHLDQLLREKAIAPKSYTKQAPNGVGGSGGPANYWVPVYKNAQDAAPVLILWIFDSRGGFDVNQQGVPDWVDSSVASWISSETAAMEAAWGPSSNRSAVAFVHIPPNVIKDIQGSVDPGRNPGMNADALGQGSVQAASPGTEGQDKPWWDALTSKVKNLHAVVSGHDHGNEWCIRVPDKNVVFCFDKHSGYGGYTRDGWGYGVRNIQFTSPDPTTPVKTWIRLEGGEQRAVVTLGPNYKRRSFDESEES